MGDQRRADKRKGLPALATAIFAFAAWGTSAPYVGNAAGLEVNTRAIVEVVDHVIPGAVLMLVGLGLARWTSLSLALVGVLAALWMAGTHLPLVVQAASGGVDWTAALWHSVPGFALFVLTVGATVPAYGVVDQPGNSIRRRVRVRGTVQGVGFRPFVYGVATRLGLGGFVLNDPGGVLIEVEGETERVEGLIHALRSDPPPLAVVDEIAVQDIPTIDERDFAIRASDQAGDAIAAVAPDVATCADCLAEIADENARRYGYAFTNCTNCGPRLTITAAVPYDRPNTTMNSFEMCAACKTEYEDPSDRRFHAQPIACPDCGPSLKLLSDGAPTAVGAEIADCARMLREGAIVAIKGLGGYHLACDALSNSSVRELRARKAREEKPFAVMVPDIDWVGRIADASPEELGVLTSVRRPIVLLRSRIDSPIAASVAPGNRFVGVMLPYTPLHHMLMAEVGRPIVLTSGNLSDEPIAYRDDDALTRLHAVADAFLMHDRDIHIRCDDSVVRVVEGAEYPIRRARGYAPEPMRVAQTFPSPVLAAGPELKHTFCLGTGDRAILSQHIGDLENYEAMAAFTSGVEHFKKLFEVDPGVIAYDLHPDYLATKWARSQEGLELVGVQHHHAHIASCLGDNGRSEIIVGVALDGTGFGDDERIWGFEFLVCDLRRYERVAHLRYVPLPGGSAAVREPWRMAAVYLDAAFGDDALNLPLEIVQRTGDRWAPILQMTRTGLNSPLASSAGRLFDAVAALCGVRDRVSYEGQAPAELEQLADSSVDDAYPCSVTSGEIDGVELFVAAAGDLMAGRPPSEVAAAFHNGVADAVVRTCKEIRGDTGLRTAALSGGSFQNLLLLERVSAGLESAGFEVLRHRRVPCNDGGISLGQALVASAAVEMREDDVLRI